MFKPDPFYEFPPFFTRQPNEDTWKIQRATWMKVITQYCQEEGQWKLSHSSAVFHNPRIQRRLDVKAVDEILDYMCTEGEAEKVGQSEIYVYKEKPSTLADMLSQWAIQSGNSGAVMTFYELTEGEYPGLELFKDMDTYLLKKAADILVKQRKAAKMKDSGETIGLKFA